MQLINLDNSSHDTKAIIHELHELDYEFSIHIREIRGPNYFSS